MDKDYAFIGLKVPRIAIIGGFLLISWGIMAYLLQESESRSITAMIPSFLGLPLFGFGILSEVDETRKHHYMHASMVFSLLMILGGMRIISADNPSTLLVASHLMLIFVGSAFIFVGIKSFKHNRLFKEQE
ncbi:MAG: hypothetical protein HN533_01510 [Euryarchaeota archaeon]|jgi:hypothetical protein|nr:hypothetical protein [Euryarchaeota archaeon]MBT4803247.1 hypothetical protein [Euryarchaeota archaeon]MBT6684106.1 hypothetical protein [Euryarchaeota archaeon]